MSYVTVLETNVSEQSAQYMSKILVFKGRNLTSFERCCGRVVSLVWLVYHRRAMSLLCSLPGSFSL